MSGHTRAVLTTRFGEMASKVHILYGGSVNQPNASAIVATFNVGGADQRGLAAGAAS